MSIQKLKRDFIKRFNSISSGKHNRDEVFRDWAECAAITAHNSTVTLDILTPNDAYYAFEKRYLEVVKKYEDRELKTFAEMLGVVQEALNLAKVDFLGQVYEKLEISGKPTKGEFFTPFQVAKMMAYATLDREFIQNAITEKGYFDFLEPAVGSGNLLIAAAQKLEELSFDPRQHMVFTAVDVNQMFCHMTYIQAGCLGLSGWVCHGNSLSLEMWSKWPTPQLQLSIRRNDMTPEAKLQAVFEEFAAADEVGAVVGLTQSEVMLPPQQEQPEQVSQEVADNSPLPEPQDTAEEGQEPVSVEEADFTPRQLNLFGEDWQGEET